MSLWNYLNLFYALLFLVRLLFFLFVKHLFVPKWKVTSMGPII